MILKNKCTASARDRLSTLFPKEDDLDKQDFTLLHETVLGLNSLDLRTLLASLSMSIINKGDAFSRTAAWWAAIRGDRSSLSLLIKYGADINRANYQARRSLDAAISSKCDTCVKLLIDSGHDVIYRDTSGWTPLHHCSYYGTSTDIMKRLIDEGADIEACDVLGASLVHYAAQRNNAECLRFLISCGANLNKLDSVGDSALYYAIQVNSYQTLQLLLEYHADCSLKNKTGESLLHFAAQHADNRCLAILRSFNLLGINVQDIITGISSSQTMKGLVGLTALQIAERRKDVTPEWLDTFRKQVHEVEFLESRPSTDDTAEEVEETDFEDAVENQD